MTAKEDGEFVTKEFKRRYINKSNLFNYQLVEYDWKHGPTTSPKENGKLAYVEDIWEQIDKAEFCQNGTNLKSRIKNAATQIICN